MVFVRAMRPEISSTCPSMDTVSDYILMSSDILYLVETLNVNDRIESDHMPVKLYCKCQVNSDTTNVEEKAVKRHKYIWHVDRIDQFQANLLGI